MRKCSNMGTSLVVQWLRLFTPTAGDAGLVPGWGTKIPHALQPGKKDPLIMFLPSVQFLEIFFCTPPYTTFITIFGMEK